jgi:AraC-like DNA-binding protein
MTTRTRGYLLASVAGIFQTLRVSAAIREGAHPRVWDGTGWYGLHAEPNIAELELQHGVELERAKYNVRSLQKARLTARPVLGEHAGLSDLFVPIVKSGAVVAVLAVGPFMTAPPKSADVLRRFRGLTGRHGHPSDPEFAHYVTVTLDTLVLEGRAAKTLERFLLCFARLLGGEASDALFAEAAALRAELEPARRVERTWDAVRTMVDERTTRAWSSPQRRDDLTRLGLPRVPEQALLGLLVGRRDEPDPVDELLRRDALQRACADLAHATGHVVSGRVGDYGVVFLSAMAGAPARRRQRLLDLGERAATLARRRFGLSLHLGLSAGARSLFQHYEAALGAAELALSRGVRVVETLPDAPATFPLHELRQELGKLVEERPRELPARFERYLEAVAVHAGYRLESARGHLEAGFEHVAGVLFESGAFDQNAFVDTSRGLARAARDARTITERFDAHRRVIHDLCDAVQKPTSARKEQRLDRAVAHIHRHYAEPLRQSAVARVAGFAPNYFSTLFKKREGMTFEVYLCRLRIERAKQLLANSELALRRVAELAGFGTRHYFARVFRREVGVTPLAYRRRER